MKTFNESMINNYKEFNNKGSFEIEGYMVKFNNNTKELETEYPFASDLRVWWFGLEKEEKEDKRAELIKEQGFEEITEEAINKLENMTTKSAKFTLDRMQKYNRRIFKKDNLVIVHGQCYVTAKELKQLEKVYGCETKDAQIYFDEIGMIRVWNKLSREAWTNK
jgi:hypothetical protein